MNYLDQFIVQFSGLADGKHQFEFDVKGGFFHQFEFSEINQCEINVQMEMYKMPDMLEMNFNFDGFVICECDRCLEEFKQPVSGDERLIAKFGDESEEGTEEIIVLSSTEHQIDLSKFIYESIILLLPQRKVHPEDENGNSECNPEIIKKLNDLNNTKNSDPRWENLKKLTSNN